MPKNPYHTARRHRSDRMLPQVCLGGLTSPSNREQVCFFDRQQQRWFDIGTPGLGPIKGFYNYPLGSAPNQTVARAFDELEVKVPIVRHELDASGVSGWVKQLDYFIDFPQMLRASSELFGEQDLVHEQQLAFLKIEEVPLRYPSKTKPGTFNATLNGGPDASEG